MPIADTDVKYYLTKSTASADGESGGNGLGGYRSSNQITTNTDENLFDDITAAESGAGDTEYRSLAIKNTHGTLTFYSIFSWIDPDLVPASGLTTQLESSGSETTVYVSSTTNFPSNGAFFVGDEEITYTGKTSNTFTGCSRGANSTSKSLHIAGTLCEHNQIRIAIEAPSNKSTGYVQTIVGEGTAPTGLSWSAVYTYATGLSIGDLAPGEFYGIWVRRKVPAGCAAKSGIYHIIKTKGETPE
jgi:hypothetical protein